MLLLMSFMNVISKNLDLLSDSKNKFINWPQLMIFLRKSKYVKYFNNPVIFTNLITVCYHTKVVPVV